MKKLSELGISSVPWKFIHDDVVDSLEFGVVYSGDCSDLSVADGNLIAAAPKLYEALREAIVESCISYCGESPIHCPKKPGECFVQKWRAALAEAAGEEVSDGE